MIVWDEVPITLKTSLETVHAILQDTTRNTAVVTGRPETDEVSFTRLGTLDASKGFSNHSLFFSHVRRPEWRTP